VNPQAIKEEKESEQQMQPEKYMGVISEVPESSHVMSQKFEVAPEQVEEEEVEYNTNEHGNTV